MVQVFVAGYNDPAAADAALALLETQQQKDEWVIDAAVLFKDANGRVHVQEIAGAIAGGVSGGLFGHFTEGGFGREALSAAGREVEAGQTGLLAFADGGFAEAVRSGLSDCVKLAEHPLNGIYCDRRHIGACAREGPQSTRQPGTSPPRSPSRLRRAPPKGQARRRSTLTLYFVRYRPSRRNIERRWLVHTVPRTRR